MSKLYENDHYEVIETNDALGEDGKYGREGYAVINRQTGIAEHTTTIYPQAIFQADALDGALTQLDEKDEDTDAIEAIESDIVIQ